jgi:hypothetical protein
MERAIRPLPEIDLVKELVLPSRVQVILDYLDAATAGR